MKQNRNRYFSPIQVDSHTKKVIMDICDRNGFKISAFLRHTMHEIASGSFMHITGSFGHHQIGKEHENN